MIFNSNPANMNSIIAGIDPSTWNIAAIPSSMVREFDQNFHPDATGASTCRGRPGPCGLATTGASTSQLTLNYGVRWDVDWGVASPPDVDHELRFRSTTTRRVGEGHSGDDRHRLRIQGQHPRQPQHRAARRLHLQRERQQRSGHPRRHRPLLHDAGVEHDLQPADLQPDGHRGVPAAGERQLPRRLALDDQSGVRRHELRAGEGGRAGAVAAHHQPGLQEPVHLAEQHRIPEADQPGDRLRARPDAFQPVPRHAHDRPEPVLQPGDRLQPESGRRRRRREPAQYGLHADCVLRRQPAAAIRRRCRWR